MDFHEAKRLLLLHGFQGADPNDPNLERGFLGSLRPYRGLREENFHEVMIATRALAPHLSSGSQVDRDVVGALWSICHYARLWGIHPEGMLRRNGLIDERDVKRLEGWIEMLSETVAMLLDGAGTNDAFEPYDRSQRG